MMVKTLALELPVEAIQWLEDQAAALGAETGEQGVTGAHIASAFVMHHFSDWTGGEGTPKEGFLEQR